MKRSRTLVAGLVDSAFAALGTFLAGLVAVRELDVRLLAAYAVIAAASVFAMPLSRQLVYIPAQVAANLRAEPLAPVVRYDVRQVVPFAALSAVVVAAVGLSLLPGRAAAGVLELAATAAAMVVVSPLQDHLRSSLHLIGRHGRAAGCSVVLALVVAAIVLVSTLLPAALPAPLVPFGALTLGNLASAVVGLRLLRGAARVPDRRLSPFAHRVRLLGAELVVQGAWLVCAYVILLLAGAAAVAALEAARVAAAPVFIVASAIGTFMSPAIVRRLNPTEPDRDGAIRELLAAVVLLLGGAALWIAVLAVGGDLVGLLLNKPFDLPLTAFRSLAASLEGLGGLVTIAMVALLQSRQILRFSVVTAVLSVAGTAVLAVPIGAFALPAAQSTAMLIRLVLNCRTVLGGMERPRATAPV